eukprot:1089114-Amphidinium_carterae.1
MFSWRMLAWVTLFLALRLYSSPSSKLAELLGSSWMLCTSPKAKFTAVQTLMIMRIKVSDELQRSRQVYSSASLQDIAHPCSREH